MALIIKCEKCNKDHLVGIECPPNLSYEEICNKTQKYLNNLKRFEEYSRKQNIIIK